MQWYKISIDFNRPPDLNTVLFKQRKFRKRSRTGGSTPGCGVKYLIGVQVLGVEVGGGFGGWAHLHIFWLPWKIFLSSTCAMQHSFHQVRYFKNIITEPSRLLFLWQSTIAKDSSKQVCPRISIIFGMFWMTWPCILFRSIDSSDNQKNTPTSIFSPHSFQHDKFVPCFFPQFLFSSRHSFIYVVIFPPPKLPLRFPPVSPLPHIDSNTPPIPKKKQEQLEKASVRESRQDSFMRRARCLVPLLCFVAPLMCNPQKTELGYW